MGAVASTKLLIKAYGPHNDSHTATPISHSSAIHSYLQNVKQPVVHTIRSPHGTIWSLIFLEWAVYLLIKDGSREVVVVCW